MTAAHQPEGQVSEKQARSRKSGLKKTAFPPFFVTLFLIGLIFPPDTSFHLGTIRLSPYRVVLILALVPALARLLSGKVGRFNAIDGLIGAHAAWAALALFVNHGLAAGVEPAGIYIIEAFGAYLIGRVYIRSAEDARALIRAMFMIVLFIAPLALYESLTEQNLFRDPVRAVMGMGPIRHIGPRMGLERAFGPFEHPILYGVFCASIMGAVYYVMGLGRLSLKAWAMAGVVAAATFFSMSTGPLVALLGQVGLIGWDRLTSRIRNRWKLLTGLIVAAWIFVSIVSTRDPVRVFIWYFAFSRESSYNRILIWEYGTAEVARHPIFGIGLGDWIRAPWMSSSMDNFWLVEAVRYGLPSLIFLVSAILLLTVRITRGQRIDQEFGRFRSAWLVSLAGIALAGATVHFWNALFVLFFFFVGSGAWLLEQVRRRERG
ncbi:MAG: O-antigen ligase family protein [Alphaproteobacteria bacterium]|nr:O-antigen ligase family protein [Alphaproteobacteria bacterium]